MWATSCRYQFDDSFSLQSHVRVTTTWNSIKTIFDKHNVSIVIWVNYENIDVVKIIGNEKYKKFWKTRVEAIAVVIVGANNSSDVVVFVFVFFTLLHVLLFFACCAFLWRGVSFVSRVFDVSYSVKDEYRFIKIIITKTRYSSVILSLRLFFSFKGAVFYDDSISKN